MNGNPRSRFPRTTVVAFLGAWAWASGCAHHVSWEVQPKPSYNLPSGGTSGVVVSVVFDGRDCKPVADALVSTLGKRTGIDVRSGAGIRLEVRNCDRGQQRTMEFDDGMDAATGSMAGSAFSGGPDKRRYTIRGWSSAELSVISATGSSVVLSGSANRTVNSPWVPDDDLDVNRSISLADDLANEVAGNLANQLAPVPVSLRRTVYSDAPPGSAHDLHNRAVAAEQAGDLVAALRLARQAQAEDPCRAGAEYVLALQAHASTVGEKVF